MGDSESNNPESSSAQETIAFYYLKTPDYRIVHVDGAIGGVTPQGNIQVSVYAEHAAIPQKAVFHVTEDGALGDEIVDQRVARDGLIREMSVSLVMTETATREFIEFLNRKLEDLSNIKRVAAEARDAVQSKRVQDPR